MTYTPFPARTARKRAFIIFLWFAALLHAPLVPTRLFDWLRLALSAREMELAEVEGEAIIPVDFDLVPGEPAAPPPEPAAAPPPPPPAAAPAVTAEGPEPKRAEVADAGAPESADAAAPVASADPDAGAKPALRDPLAAAGAVGKLASKDPNVQVLIASEKIRKHELGAAFGRLLTNIPEWKSFFDGTNIDPIRDFDHVFITGPQFRDSSKVVAVMDYNLPETRIRDAIGVVLDRSNPKGEWLDDTPVPAASARADEGDRIFALVPGKRLLAVLPPDAKNQLGSLKANKGFSKTTGGAIVISMVTPSRAFKNLPIQVPETIKWMRVHVHPTADGGADVQLEAMDASPELAAEHAKELTAQIEALRKPNLGIFSGLASIELFAPVKLEASGPLLRARTHVTESQLRRIMTHAESAIGKMGKRGGRAKNDAKNKRPAPNEPAVQGEGSARPPRTAPTAAPKQQDSEPQAPSGEPY